MKNDQAGGSQTSKKLGATSDMEQWLCKSIFGHVKASYFLFSTYWRILLSLSSVQNLGPETEFETQPYICDGSPALDPLVIHVYMVKVLKTTKQMIWLWFHNNIFILCTTYICQNNQIYLLFLKSSVGLAGALYLTPPREIHPSINPNPSIFSTTLHISRVFPNAKVNLFVGLYLLIENQVICIMSLWPAESPETRKWQNPSLITYRGHGNTS